jgi:hypothetical protein
MTGPYFAPFVNVMPEALLDGVINNYGIRLGWMKSHTCPCTMGSEIPGSPDAGCLSCLGRGIYWEQPVAFSGLITYMHTSSAPDEPGFSTDTIMGQIQRAEPTLTIPVLPNNTIWSEASAYDAYVEYDAVTRFNTTLVVGQTSVLPYPFNVIVTGVTSWDLGTRTTTNVPGPATPMTDQNGNPILDQNGNIIYLSGGYVVNGSSVTLPNYPVGTSYVVDYTATPVYIAYRSAGGLPHTRPFGIGTGQIPRRFHIVALDVWFRSRLTGDPSFPVITG